MTGIYYLYTCTHCNLTLNPAFLTSVRGTPGSFLVRLALRPSPACELVTHPPRLPLSGVTRLPAAVLPARAARVAALPLPCRVCAHPSLRGALRGQRWVSVFPLGLRSPRSFPRLWFWWMGCVLPRGCASLELEFGAVGPRPDRDRPALLHPGPGARKSPRELPPDPELLWSLDSEAAAADSLRICELSLSSQ